MQEAESSKGNADVSPPANDKSSSSLSDLPAVFNWVSWMLIHQVSVGGGSGGGLE